MHDGHQCRGLVLALALFTFAGCSHQATDPVSTSAANDVPVVTDAARTPDGPVHLATGDRAVYEWTTRTRELVAGAQPGPWTSRTQRIVRETGNPVSLNGNTYLKQSEFVENLYGSPGPAFGLFVRQDRTGLYFYQNNADTHVIRDVPILLYPLHPGAEWSRDQSYAEYRVDGRESIQVQAGSFTAWRVVGVRSNVFASDPTGWTYWYGVPGEILRTFHGSTELYDATGKVIGTTESEERFELVSWVPAGGA